MITEVEVLAHEYFLHVLSWHLHFGSFVDPRRPPLPHAIVVYILRLAGCVSHRSRLLAHATENTATQNFGLFCSTLWFVSPPLDARASSRVARMVLSTKSAHKSRRFDISLFSANGEIKPVPGHDSSPWVSHYEREFRTEGSMSLEGTPFESDHDIWTHLQPGDCIAVSIMAQFSSFLSIADEGRLHIWEWFVPNYPATEKWLQEMEALRQEMLSLPAGSDIQPFLRGLSALYMISGRYPSEELDSREITRTQEISEAGGGFGRCYKGDFLDSPSHAVAMKSLYTDIRDESVEDYSRRVKREVDVWRKLRHPHVLPFIGSVVLGTTQYMVSPWKENGEVRRYLRSHPNANRNKLLLQVAMGLEYLHTLNPAVVHGDIKGPNILISSTGDACIADFGLSHKEGSDFHVHSLRWQVAGNYRWQAPELLRAKTLPQSVRTTMTDIYAFGRVILEVFTHEVPFHTMHLDHEVTEYIKRHNLPPRPRDPEVVSRGLDDRMWQLVERCSHKHATKRLSAQELVEQLQKICLEPRMPRNDVSQPLSQSSFHVPGLRPWTLSLPPASCF
ncbi:hypothetical protein BOTBODRAFT_444438 [Botryobasidium botryosum FD-172 SS1]|uniref:Protein kinase domain-containing protein n=1 Tax=Botryobasidium botryosum (strain FD-172 SS1) TaxID=930990 RepID=A0A067N663_BOTB1|nr:hypothetical protein BOTBODRAFT_444438 [Botryobasidium botryosum FD-172 SS1]